MTDETVRLDPLLQTRARLGQGKIVFNDLELVRKLGAGGMGEVWLAQRTRLNEQVALKFLPDLAKDPSGMVALLKEYQLAKRLVHQNIVAVNFFHEDESSTAVEMEYVDGTNLAELIAKQPNQWFEVEHAAEHVRGLCRAIAHAWEETKLVHRDIKPANMLVDRKTNRVRVVDFGIAANVTTTVNRLTGSATSRHAMGTIPYMSPEQLRGGVDHRNDVYSIGATIYQLLTGTPPFRGNEVSILTMQILKEDAERMTSRRDLLMRERGDSDATQVVPVPIPDEWEEVVAACLEKEAANRPQSAQEVLAMIEGSRAPMAVSRGSRRAKENEAAAAKKLAEELKLAAEKLAAEKAAAEKLAAEKAALEEQMRQKAAAEAAARVAAEKRKRRNLMVGVGVTCVAIVGVFGAMKFRGQGGTTTRPDPGSPPVQPWNAPVPTPENPHPVNPIPVKPVAVDNPVQPKSDQPAPGPQTPGQVNGKNGPVAPVMPRQTWQIMVTAPSRVIVSDDKGGPVFDGTLNAGQGHALPVDKEFLVELKSGRDLSLEIDGQVRPAPAVPSGRWIVKIPSVRTDPVVIKEAPPPFEAEIGPLVAKKSVNQPEADWLRNALGGGKGDKERDLARQIFAKEGGITVGQWRARTAQTFTPTAAALRSEDPLKNVRVIDLPLPPGGEKMRLIRIEPGSYQKGSPTGEKGRLASDQTSTTVKIPKPFFIGIYEVTNKQFSSVDRKNNPSWYGRNANGPVDQVKWNEHIKGPNGFISRLNVELAKTYEGLLEADLPTDDQWEYACRAGTTSAINIGRDLEGTETDQSLNLVAVYRQNKDSGPKAVGSKLPNAWGLFDMHGNVQEWTRDLTIRGGSWESIAGNCRSASRVTGSENTSDTTIGFRVVLKFRDAAAAK